jgi:hypothetical protein
VAKAEMNEVNEVNEMTAVSGPRPPDALSIHRPEPIGRPGPQGVATARAAPAPHRRSSEPLAQLARILSKIKQ